MISTINRKQVKIKKHIAIPAKSIVPIFSPQHHPLMGE
jgi:hypothetical protein